MVESFRELQMATHFFVRKLEKQMDGGINKPRPLRPARRERSYSHDATLLAHALPTSN